MYAPEANKAIVKSAAVTGCRTVYPMTSVPVACRFAHVRIEYAATELKRIKYAKAKKALEGMTHVEVQSGQRRFIALSDLDANRAVAAMKIEAIL